MPPVLGISTATSANVSAPRMLAMPPIIHESITHAGRAAGGLIDGVRLKEYACTYDAADNDRHCGHYAKVLFESLLFHC